MEALQRVYYGIHVCFAMGQLKLNLNTFRTATASLLFLKTEASTLPVAFFLSLSLTLSRSRSPLDRALCNLSGSAALRLMHLQIVHSLLSLLLPAALSLVLSFSFFSVPLSHSTNAILSGFVHFDSVCAHLNLHTLR